MKHEDVKEGKFYKLTSYETPWGCLGSENTISGSGFSLNKLVKVIEITEEVYKGKRAIQIRQEGHAYSLNCSSENLEDLDPQLKELYDDEYVQQVGTWKIIQRLEEEVKATEKSLAAMKESHDMLSEVFRLKMENYHDVTQENYKLYEKLKEATKKIEKLENDLIEMQDQRDSE